MKRLTAIFAVLLFLTGGCTRYVPANEDVAEDGTPRSTAEESAQDSTENHDIDGWEQNDTVDYIITPEADTEWEDTINVEFDFG